MENSITHIKFNESNKNTQKTSNTIEINPTNITEITTYDINNSYGNQMANPGQITDPNGPGGTNPEATPFTKPNGPGGTNLEV